MNRKEYNQEYDVFETPDKLWENIEKQLEEPRKKRRIGWWISSVGVAAAAVLVSLLIWNQDGDPVQKESKAPMMANAETNQKTDENTVDSLKVMQAAYDANKNAETRVNQSAQQSAAGASNAISGNQNVTYHWSITDANGNRNVTTWGGDAASPTTNPFSSGFDGSQGGGNGGGIGADGGPGTVSYNYTAPSTNLISQSQSTFSVSNGLSANYSGTVNLPTTTNQSFGNVTSSVTERPTRRGYAPDPFIGEYDFDYQEPYHGSTYDAINENQFISTKEEAQSTFSIDVDGASYSDVRGMIKRGVLPNPNAVRIEELINYFPYNYDEPKGDDPFAFHSEVIDCPWNSEHQLMKIGIKGESIEKEALPPNNLVFLMDVSGSMTSPEKLGLIKKGFNLLVQEMREEDRVAICVYAGAAGLVLEPTSGANKDKIMDAINRLEAGGSTAGGQGIELAYSTAQKYFNADGNNRVILATDGDFNVGVSNDDDLVSLIERKRESGVALTVLGVGHDNFQSSKMEKIANNGNGNFSYIDNILEAKKVLVTEMGATLKTIAKDVKLQLDFNPEKIERYRLLGYENRMLANEDFDNDAVDAGELGAGHTVTAIYEIIPVGAAVSDLNGDRDVIGELENIIERQNFEDGELAVLKFRYKQPQGSTSKLITTSISQTGTICSTDMRFITAVVEYGLLLRNSEFKGTANFERILKNARLGLGRDPYGYRSEFIQLVQKTQRLRNTD